jgi:hypothetical protein
MIVRLFYVRKKGNDEFDEKGRGAELVLYSEIVNYSRRHINNWGAGVRKPNNALPIIIIWEGIVVYSNLQNTFLNSCNGFAWCWCLKFYRSLC